MRPSRKCEFLCTTELTVDVKARREMRRSARGYQIRSAAVRLSETEPLRADRRKVTATSRRLGKALISERERC